MNRAEPNRSRPKPAPDRGVLRNIHFALFGLFLLALAVVCSGFWLRAPLFGEALWPEGVLVVLAAAVTVAGMLRQLPGQNVMLVAVLAAVIGSAAHCLGALTSIPFGPFYFTGRIGRELFHPLPWAIPFLWIIVVFNSRGVARLILRPWRKIRAYGFWLIGLTIALVMLFVVALEPFASRVQHYWTWNATRIPVHWHSAPLSDFPAWGVITLFILAFATPWLLNKKPVKFPPDYSPLVMWLLLNGLFLAGAAAHQLWIAAGVILAQNAVVAAYAIRGGRW